MIPRPPRSTLTHTLCPYTTYFRSPASPSLSAERVPATPDRGTLPAHRPPRRFERSRSFRCDRAAGAVRGSCAERTRSEEHTSELQSLMRISYAVFCLKTKTKHLNDINELYNNTNT